MKRQFSQSKSKQQHCLLQQHAAVRNISNPPECADAFFKVKFCWPFGPQNYIIGTPCTKKNGNKRRISYKKGLFIE